MLDQQRINLFVLILTTCFFFLSCLSNGEEVTICQNEGGEQESPLVAEEIGMAHKGAHKGMFKGSWKASQHLESPFPERLEEMKLVAVQIIFRHGERSPLGLSFKDHPFSSPSGEEGICSTGNDPLAGPELRYPQFQLHLDNQPHTDPRVWSHSPSSASASASSSFSGAKCYSGQLSNRGKRSMLHLGKKLRKRYIEEEGLLEAATVPSESELKVLSTNISRTIESAMYLLQGLFPSLAPPPPPSPHEAESHNQEFHWTSSGRIPVVPIHLRNKREEFLSPAFRTCPRLGGLWSERSESAARENQKSSDDIISLLSGLIHPVEGITAQPLYDLLASYEANDISMPTQVSEEVFSELSRIFVETWWRFIDGHDELCRLGAGRLLGELDKVFSTPAETRPKLTLYSAHDSTLAFLLSSLNSLKAQNMGWPPCSSQMILELYEDKDAEESKEQFLRVIYNNGVLEIPGCARNEEETKAGLCSLKNFRSMIGKLVPVDFSKECNV